MDERNRIKRLKRATDTSNSKHQPGPTPAPQSICAAQLDASHGPRGKHHREPSQQARAHSKRSKTSSEGATTTADNSGMAEVEADGRRWPPRAVATSSPQIHALTPLAIAIRTSSSRWRSGTQPPVSTPTANKLVINLVAPPPPAVLEVGRRGARG